MILQKSKLTFYVLLTDCMERPCIYTCSASIAEFAVAENCTGLELLFIESLNLHFI